MNEPAPSPSAGGLSAGEVVDLFVAERTGAPIERRTWVEVVQGAGIPGDRYATRQGFWSDPKWPDQELTLVEAEVAASLQIEPGLLRRNVVTRGVRLDELIGCTFAVGSAVLYGVRPCEPCPHIERSAARPGLLQALVSRGGLRARVMRNGRMAIGDAIMLLPGPPG